MGIDTDHKTIANTPSVWLQEVAQRRAYVHNDPNSQEAQIQGIWRRFLDSIVHFFAQFSKGYFSCYQENLEKLAPVPDSSPSPDHCAQMNFTRSSTEKASSDPSLDKTSDASSFLVEMRDSEDIEGSLADQNAALRREILSTPKYSSKYNMPVITSHTILPKEYLDPFTHVHNIFGHVYLGNYRAFLSVDPNFLEQHKMADSFDEICSDMEDHPDRDAIERNVMSQVDHKGCSELGIRYILSATRFQPNKSVEDSDWSLFKPNLDGVKRLEIPVDDVDGFWNDLQPHLETAFNLIDQSRKENQPCLVHCVQGVSRSVTILTAYLINRCNVSMEDAFNFIISKRTIAALKSSIKTCLSEYAAQFVQQ